jgi:hypothetical protein
MARYKVLKSVAHSVGHSFTSLMNYRGDDYVMGHLLRRAREVGDGTLLVDILSGEAAPQSLLTRPVREAVESYHTWFPKLVESHRTSLELIASARMTITFDLAVNRPVIHAPGYVESPYVCRVELIDDRGKAWAAEIRDWWYPEAGRLIPSPSRGDRVTVIRRLGQLIRSVWSRRRHSSVAAA